MRRTWRLGPMLAVWVLAVCMLAAPQAGRAEPPGGMDLALPTLQGDIRLSDFRGQVVVVNYWATWCPPCLLEIPYLVEAQERYRHLGLTIVGVHDPGNMPSRETLTDFVAEHGINYPIVFGDREAIGKLYRFLGWPFGLPTTKFIDRQGNVVRSHTGMVTPEQLREMLEPLLGPLLDPPSGPSGAARFMLDGRPAGV